MELPSRYPYNGSGRVIFACGAFFGAISALMAYTAIHNRAGLIIDGIIKFEPGGATIFYWVVSALSSGFVFLILLGLLKRVVNPQVLVIEADALLLPKGFFQTQISRIPYTDIQEFSEVQLSGQTYLRLTVYGQKFNVNAALFQDKASYVVVRDFLISHIRH